MDRIRANGFESSAVIRRKFVQCLFVVLGLVVLQSCQGIDLPPFDQQIVVEGWIENGEHPIVQLTASVPPREEKIPYEDLGNYVIKYAKVSVTADGREYPLVPVMNAHKYFPIPVAYTTDELVGEVGKTYALRIEYSGRTVTAETSIPEPPVMENLHSEKLADGMFALYADVVDRPDERNWYKFFIRKHGADTMYVSSYLALLNDEIIAGGRKEMVVSNSLGFMLSDYTPYFDAGTQVDVKLCSMTEPVYFYWKDYNDIVSFSRNPFLSVNIPIRYNVRGGYGYWAGYGKVESTIKMDGSPAVSIE